MIKKILIWLGIINEPQKKKRGSRYDYVIKLILKAKKHEYIAGNNPTTLTISEDLMEFLEMDPRYHFSGRIFGLEIKTDPEKELHISVD